SNDQPTPLFAKDTMLISYENRLLENIIASPGFLTRDQVIGKSERLLYLLYLRDPLNSMASLIHILNRKIGRDSAETMQRMSAQVETWKNLANEFLGISGILDSAVPKLCCSHNLFVRSDSYRKELAEKLALKDHRPVEHLSKFGGGGNTFFNKAEY